MSCTWTASSNVGWIAIISGAGGTGNGSVTFTVAANTATSPRSGTLTVAGQTFTVGQDGAPPLPPPCTYEVKPATKNFGWEGGVDDFDVTAPVGCAWTATSSADWVVIVSGSPGSGNGRVRYAVAVNVTGAARSATITVGGAMLTVNQRTN
jgi:hypothetical protein